MVIKFAVLLLSNIVAGKHKVLDISASKYTYVLDNKPGANELKSFPLFV